MDRTRAPMVAPAFSAGITTQYRPFIPTPRRPPPARSAAPLPQAGDPPRQLRPAETGATASDAGAGTVPGGRRRAPSPPAPTAHPPAGPAAQSALRGRT